MNQSFSGKRAITIVALIGAMILWASSFIALKYTFESFDAIFVIFSRMGIATIFILMFFPKKFYKSLLMITPNDFKYLISLALFEPCMYFIFEAEALKNTTASQAGIITALLPVMVATGAWIWIGEKITWRLVTGGLMAFAGVVWISLNADAATNAPNPFYGNMMELLAMVSAAGYTLILKHLSGKFGPLFITAFQSLIGSLFFASLLVLLGKEIPTSFPLAPSLALLYLGIAITFGAYGLYNYGVSKIPASQASLYINLIPVFAVILSYLLLGEKIGWIELIGGGAILTGVLIAQHR